MLPLINKIRKKSKSMKVDLDFVILTMLLVFAYSYSCKAQDLEAWEKDDLKSNCSVYIKPIPKPRFSSLIDETLINFYKKAVSPTSISGRCPFDVSCSSFALHQIRTYGLFYGVIRSVDRMFYRENPMSFKMYPFISNNRIYKLDDHFFMD